MTPKAPKPRSKYNFAEMIPGESMYYEGARTALPIAYGWYCIRGKYTTKPSDDGKGWYFSLKSDNHQVTADDESIDLHLKVDSEFLSLIDRWRDRQTSKPNRSEAIRRLIKQAIQKK